MKDIIADDKRREANRIRREISPIAFKLRNFEKHMEQRRAELQSKYDELYERLKENESF